MIAKITAIRWLEAIICWLGTSDMEQEPCTVYYIRDLKHILKYIKTAPAPRKGRKK